MQAKAGKTSKISKTKQTKQTKQTKNDNYLLYVPLKKHPYWEVKEGKILLIFYHDKLGEKFLRWFVKKPYVSDITFDEIGSKVWFLIDGSNTVYDIADNLLRNYGPDFDPGYRRLIMFLNYLHRKGWIFFKN